ncbi:hypothetical protein ACFQZ0_11855 [Streptomyces erythrogriseus]
MPLGQPVGGFRPRLGSLDGFCQILSRCLEGSGRRSVLNPRCTSTRHFALRGGLFGGELLGRELGGRGGGGRVVFLAPPKARPPVRRAGGFGRSFFSLMR